MKFYVTDSAVEAIKDHNENQIAVAISEIRISSTRYAPSDAMYFKTAMDGPAVYTAPVTVFGFGVPSAFQAIHPLDESVGDFMIGEVSFWLNTGEMYAIGVSQNGIEKTANDLPDTLGNKIVIKGQFNLNNRDRLLNFTLNEEVVIVQREPNQWDLAPTPWEWVSPNQARALGDQTERYHVNRRILVNSDTAWITAAVVDTGYTYLTVDNPEFFGTIEPAIPLQIDTSILTGRSDYHALPNLFGADGGSFFGWGATDLENANPFPLDSVDQASSTKIPNGIYYTPTSKGVPINGTLININTNNNSVSQILRGELTDLTYTRLFIGENSNFPLILTEKGVYLFGDTIRNIVSFPTIKNLRDCAGNASSGIAVFVGDAGAIYTSINNGEFESITTPYTFDFQSIAVSSASRFVAIHNSNQLVQTDDGFSFELSGTSLFPLQKIKFANGVFIAFGSTASGLVVAKSTDNAETWAYQIALPSATYPFFDIGYDSDANIWAIKGENGIAISSDNGVSWTESTPVALGLALVNSFKWINDLWVEGGEGASADSAGVGSSEDLAAFTTETLLKLNGNIVGVESHPNLDFVFATKEGSLAASVDALDTIDQLPVYWNKNSAFDLAHNGTVSIIAAGNEILKSSDSEKWVNVVVPDYVASGEYNSSSESNKYLCVGYGNTKFVIGGEGGKVYESVDLGSSWVQKSLGVTEDIYSVVYFQGFWYAGGEGGKLFKAPHSAIGTLTAWTPIVTGHTTDIRAILRTVSTLFLVGANSTIIASTDEIIFNNKVTPAADGTYFAIVKNDDTIVVVGDKILSGTQRSVSITSIDDGVTFGSENYISSANSSFRSIVWDGNKYIVAGISGDYYPQVYTSPTSGDWNLAVDLSLPVKTNFSKVVVGLENVLLLGKTAPTGSAIPNIAIIKTNSELTSGSLITSIEFDYVNTLKVIGRYQGWTPWKFIGDTTFGNGSVDDNSPLHVGPSPPANSTKKPLWWSSVLGRMFLSYNDGDSVQWVEASPSAAQKYGTKVFEGSVTYSDATFTYEFEHGLGKTPEFFQFFMRLKPGQAQAGFTAGKSYSIDQYTGTNSWNGVSPSADEARLYLRTGGANPGDPGVTSYGIILLNDSGASSSVDINSKWDILVKAVGTFIPSLSPQYMADYTGNEQIVTSLDMQFLWAHGLAIKPKVYQFYLKNLVTDLGYQPGDIVPLSMNENSAGINNSNSWADDTYLAFNFDSTRIRDKSGVSIGAVSGASKWAIGVYAYTPGLASVSGTTLAQLVNLGPLAPQTYSLAGSTYTFSHGLGVIPDVVSVKARVLPGQTDLGYLENEVILLSSYINNSGGSDRGFGIKLSEDDVFLIVDTDGIPYEHATSGASGTLAVDKWQFEVVVSSAQFNNSPFLQKTSFDPAFTSKSATIVLAHGLVRRPFMVQVFMVCTVAEGGFSVFQQVLPDAISADHGVYVNVDDVNITIRSGKAGIHALNPSGDNQALSPGKWKFLVNVVS